MADPSLNPFAGGPPDDWHAYRRYPYLLARLALILTLLGIVVWLLHQAAGVLSMVFISSLLAYVLDPVVDWLERFKIPRSLAILLLLIGAVGFAIVFALWMIPTIVREFSEVGGRLHTILGTKPETATDWVTNTFGITFSQETVDAARAKLQEALPSVLSYVGEFLRGAAARTMGVVGWLLNIIMIPVFCYYFLRDFDKTKAWIADQIPLAHRPSVIARARRIDLVIGAWLRGQVQVALILAVIYASGLAIVGLPIGIPIGILAGLLSVVPYLGFAFGATLALLMVILDWQGLGHLGQVAIVFTIGQCLEAYVLTPRIVGEKVGLSPVAIIIVLLMGGELFGLLGFMLAVPVAGASKTVLVELLDWYRSSETFLGPAPEVKGAAEDAL